MPIRSAEKRRANRECDGKAGALELSSVAVMSTTAAPRRPGAPDGHAIRRPRTITQTQTRKVTIARADRGAVRASPHRSSCLRSARWKIVARAHPSHERHLQPERQRDELEPAHQSPSGSVTSSRQSEQSARTEAIRRLAALSGPRGPSEIRKIDREHGSRRARPDDESTERWGWSRCCAPGQTLGAVVGARGRLLHVRPGLPTDGRCQRHH